MMQMTELGKMTYGMVSAFGLGEYYQECAGNIIIPESELTVELMATILRFLENNQDWVMGYECYPDVEAIYYLNQKQYLD